MIKGNTASDSFLRVMDSIDKKNDGVVVPATASNKSIMDRIFYSVDKTLEKGIKGTIDFFSTTNIFIEDMVEYSTKTPNVTILYAAKKDIDKYRGEGFKFYTVANKKAPVILGMSIPLPKLYTILNANKDYVKTLEDSMYAFNTTLEDLINSKKDRIVLDIDTDDIKALGKQIDTINKEISVVTNNKVMSDRKPIKQLVGNFVEYSELVDKSIALGEVYSMERLESIYEINEAIVQKLDIIYNSIKEHETNMDSKSFKDFVDYINVIAKYTTAVTFLFYLYYQLLNMLISIHKIVEITNDGDGMLSSVINRISTISKKFDTFVRQLV